jgi:protein-S-isoprenylcysteine O-methyltransferase Ste14
MHPGLVIVVLWIAWGLSWIAAAVWTNKTEKKPALREELGYHLLVFIGFALLIVPAHGDEGASRLWRPGHTGAWLCATLAFLGFAFTWWARIHLGRLWSGTITRKTGHHIVDTGPYAIVRHPIYTGLLLAVYATLVAKGTWFGIAGALLVTLGFWIKAKQEEQWLAQELGAEPYADYRRRVPMLIPFGPKPR